MVLRLVRQSAVAVVSPRVPAILSRPSSPGEATILSQKEGAVAVRMPTRARNGSCKPEGGCRVVGPRVPAILLRPSSPGEATILSQKDLDWLQSGWSFHRHQLRRRDADRCLGDRSSAVSVEQR